MTRPPSTVIIAPRVRDLASIFPILGVDVLLTCEDGPDLRDISRRFGARTLSLEAVLRRRRRWRSSDLDELVALASDVLAGSRVLPYASAAALEAIGSAAVYAVHAGLKRELDDKHATRRLLARAGIPVPPHILLPLGPARPAFDQIARDLGVPFVLQPRMGSAGVGTTLITDSPSYGLASDSGVASRLAGLTTLNVHGVVGEHAVEVSIPTVQLTGIAGFGTQWGGYCGSDAVAVRRVPAEMVETARGLTARVGALLARLGYRGVFGIDLAAGDGGVEVLEINPRFQASTWLLDEVARWHLHAFGVVPAGPATISAGSAFLVVNAPEQLTVAREIRSGNYEWVEDRLCLSSGSAAVSVSGSPARGTTVDQGATVIRVRCEGETLAADGGRALTPFGSRLLAAASELVREHCV